MIHKDNYRRVLGRMNMAAAVLTVLFIGAVIAMLFCFKGTLSFDMPEGRSIYDYTADNDLITIDSADGKHVTFRSNGGSGETLIISRDNGSKDLLCIIRIMPSGMIYNMNNSDFSGCRGITIAFLVYLTLMSAYCIVSFVIRCKRELFSYTTLFYGGMSFFLPVIHFNILKAALRLFNGSSEFSMLNVFSFMRYAGEDFLIRTLPFVVVFSIALAVSNISLIRHEGKRFVNLLGLILSAMLLFGYIFYLILINRFSMGSAQQMKVYGAGLSVFSTAFVYFETMLFSAVLCGYIAARKKPSPDKTHVIILGCAISDDGTPLPLLRGRIDRAIAFAKEQQEKTGKEITFVPSGGKGSDEVISESQSMTDYLVSQGISRDRIIMEDKSVNTVQNMQFSLEKIKAVCDEPNIIFSTSAYHVLRSGMISRTAGLDAEGIGSRTKWYFWPNAYVREFIGLLASKWKRHVLIIVLLTVFFIGINIILPM